MEQDIVFERNTVEFVTVAQEYCAFVERSVEDAPTERVLTDIFTKLLPLLYLKASLLSKEELIVSADTTPYVTETLYEHYRGVLAEIMGAKDTYLEVFTADMAYSEEALPKSVAEDLCDLYQALRDFLFAFQTGVNETMHDAVVICQEGFESYWGQTLVNCLRALHAAKYSGDNDED